MKTEQVLIRTQYADKHKILEWLLDWKQRNNIPDVPNATAEELQEEMRQAGIKPEDNEFSCMILHDRYGEEGNG